MTRKQFDEPDVSAMEPDVHLLPNPSTAEGYISELISNAPLMSKWDQGILLYGFACGWLAYIKERERIAALEGHA